jgi:hypothetical protein
VLTAPSSGRTPTLHCATAQNTAIFNKVWFCTSVSAVYRLPGMQQSTRRLEIHCDVYWQTCLQGVMLLLSPCSKTVPLSTWQLISLWRHIAKWRHHVCQFRDLGCKWDGQMRVLFKEIDKQTLSSPETSSTIIYQFYETTYRLIFNLSFALRLISKGKTSWDDDQHCGF